MIAVFIGIAVALFTMRWKAARQVTTPQPTQEQIDTARSYLRLIDGGKQ